MQTILTLSLPFLEMHSDLRMLRASNRELRFLVDQHISTSRKIRFDGRTVPLMITSPKRLTQFLLSACNPNVEKLEFIGVKMILPEEENTTATNISEMELSWSDEKSRIFPFPLDILPRFKNLKELRVESNSKTEDMIRDQNMRYWKSTRECPLQISLANLHELADNCPFLEILMCYHVEVNVSGEITDCWGPDCTPEVCRKFKKHCPKLRELGVMSSPGPRMLRELRRSGKLMQNRPITETPEIQETFVHSFLSELVTIQRSNLQVYASITSSSTPDSSSRSTVLHFRDEFAGEETLGELGDCLKVAGEINERINLEIIVRATATRGKGPLSIASMKENIQISTAKGIFHEIQAAGISLIQVPGDSIRFHEISLTSKSKQRKVNMFGLSVSLEPKRSMTETSFQSEPNKFTKMKNGASRAGIGGR